MKSARRAMKILAAAVAALIGVLVSTAAAANGPYRPHPPGPGYARPPVAAPAYPGYGRGYWGGPRYNVGVYFGPGVWGAAYPWFYPPYPYYYPAYTYAPPVVTVVPNSPPTYIEKGAQAQASEPSDSSWWYFCREANGYYPYVRQCPGGWERVSPQPPER